MGRTPREFGGEEKKTHLVVHSTNGPESLIPQRHVPWNLCRHSSGKDGGDCGVWVDAASRVVVPEHFAGAGEGEGLDGHIGLIEDADGVWVARIGEKGSAEGVEGASEWVVSRA